MTSRLLIDENPLIILPRLAQILGVSEAIVIQQIHYWVSAKIKNNHFHGKYWVYNTYEQWNKQFPFWCERSVRKAIKSLERQGVLLSFVTKDFKKKKYYTINYPTLRKLEESFDKGVSDNSPSSVPTSLDDDSGTSLLEESENGENPIELGDLSMWQNLPYRHGKDCQIDLAGLATSYNKDTETTFTKTTLLPQTPSSGLIDEEEEEESKNGKSKKDGSNTLSLLEKAVQVWERIVHPSLKTNNGVHLTATRSEKLATLFRGVFQNDVQKWEAYCQKIAETPFLLGNGTKGGWKVTFDWALEESNAIKVLEDYYFSGDVEGKQSVSPALVQQNVFEQIQATCPPELQETWMKVCNNLLQRMDVAKFNSWILPLTPIRLTGPSVEFLAPTRFTRDYIRTNFYKLLLNAVQTVSSATEALELTVKEEKNE